MSKFKNALNARDNHIRTLRAACGIMLVLLVLSMLGWMMSPRNLTIHNPPDLRSGSSRLWWEISPSTVYAFSFYIFQQLNSWPKDGDVDYPPQDVLEERFNHLAKNAIGENTESERVRADADTDKSYLGERHKLYRASMTFFLSGESLKILNSRQRDLTAILLNAGLQPIKPEYDVAPLNGYLRALPMCFNPTLDKKNWYTRLTFVQHMANMLPVFGRDTGTGHAGFTFFNRGGAPLTCDPLNHADRSKKAHLVLFGPTGSGKSATLNSLFAQLMAIHRPRLFIAEAGNSFGLFADYCAEMELSVNKVSIKPGCGISLVPFADAYKLIEAPVKNVHESELSERIEVEETDDSNAEERW